MKKHFIYTIISAIVIWGVYGPAVAFSSEDNQCFLDMINEIREDPYEYAIYHLKYDPKSLKSKGILPKVSSEPYLEPYLLDLNLTVTAAGEEASESEEESPVYRLTASTGGAVSFFNFMSRDTAFKIVIDYLFRKELDNNTFDHILSEEYAFAGIDISAGKVGSGNAWFVAISLRSYELASEIQMLNLINQIRSDPENIWKYTNLTKAEAYETNLNIPDLIYSDSEYKPLFFNASLSASAQVNNSSDVLNGTGTEPLPEVQTALERAFYYGYEGDVVQAFRLSAWSFPEENGLSVDSLFWWLIQKEIEKWPIGPNSVIFSKDFKDIGFNMAFLPGDGLDASVLSFVVGKDDPDISDEETSSSNNDLSSRVYGILFSDDDGNGLYASGEECVQQTVRVYVDEQEIQSVVTDNAGHFSMTLDTNRQYRFAVIIEGVSYNWDIPIISDQFVKLDCSLPSIEDDLQ